MSDNHQSYIRIMSDIIDSGIWAKLSSAAKTLYPVLLKFSDFHFKPVWPNTETLLGLTGFRTKKSILEAKRDLEKNGLIHVVPGSGRTSTRYYFLFDYPGSKITPLGDTNIPLRGFHSHTPGEDVSAFGRDTERNPNHINITINNNQKNETKGKKKKEDDRITTEEEKAESLSKGERILSYEILLEDFGAEVFSYAYKEAERRGLQDNLPYLKTICKNRIQSLEESLKNKQIFEQTVYSDGPSFAGEGSGFSPPGRKTYSWASFLEWAEGKLSTSSFREFQKLDVEPDGKILCIQSPVSDLQRNIIESYFEQMGDSDFSLVFASRKEVNRIF